MATRKPTTHKNHQPGFCDWLCLPKVLVTQFSSTSGWDISTPALRADVEGRVILWAQGVREQLAGQVVDDDMWTFWRARWKALERIYCDTGEIVPPAAKVAPRASSEAWRAKQDYPRVNR